MVPEMNMGVDLRQDGDKSYPTVSLVLFKKAKAARDIAPLLGVETGARVFTFVNRLALHGESVMIDNITVPVFPA
jgi:GntR family transcriptional regulator